MVQYRHEPLNEELPHWCITLIPDDELATVLYMRGTDVQNLTLHQAERKAEQLNAKLETEH